jgi:hypothetical protein
VKRKTCQKNQRLDLFNLKNKNTGSIKILKGRVEKKGYGHIHHIVAYQNQQRFLQA